MDSPTLPKWLLPCILLTALISGYCITKRVQVETRNKATSMAVEMETVESLAAAERNPISVALANLKAQGVNAVVLSEETVSDLVQQGQCYLAGDVLGLRDQPLTDRAMRGLRVRFGKSFNHAPQDSVANPSFAISIRGAPIGMVRSCSLGLNPNQAAAARSAGMIIIGRAANPQGVSNEYVKETLAWMNDLGAMIFLPSGDQVLGRRDAIETTVKTLEERNMLYASPEFTKLGGDDEVVRKIPNYVVRLHSAQSAELDKMPLVDAVDRYAKASRERNMRVLLLRPVSFASDKPLGDFAHFAQLVNENIRKDGGAMGKAKAFADSSIPWAIKLLLALSVIPTAFWVGATFVRNQNWQIAGVLMLVALSVATKTHLGLTLFALVCAIVFPLAAFLVLDSLVARISRSVPPQEAPSEREQGTDLEIRATDRHPFLSILGLFLLTTGISLVGGFAVAGLLNGLPYFVKAQEFQGIKIAVFAPILIVCVYFLCRFEDMKQAMRNPITWLSALAGLGLLVALAFMNSRTGNDNPAGVSDLELKVRNILDAVLFVRPRTKSFLIGHPLLFAGIGLMLWRNYVGGKGVRGKEESITGSADTLVGAASESAPTSGDQEPSLPLTSSPPSMPFGVLAALLLTMGAIGQTDVVNTFCHLHTPFLLSLTRTAVALVPGVILGAVIWFFLRRRLSRVVP